MAKVVKNTLGYLGVDFQYRLINAFVIKPNFFKDLYSIIDQNMFTESYLKTVVGVMKDYYINHESVPSYSLLDILLRKVTDNEDEQQYFLEALERLQNTSTEGIDEIEDMAEKFFKQQNLVRVANEIRRIAGDGDMTKYAQCQKLVEEAIAIGRHSDDASSPYDSVEDDLSKENVITIPTGISKLDDALGGGLDKGKVGVIIGSSGFGKTSMTTCMSANAAAYKCRNNNYQGFRVLQICFEDQPRDIRRKYFSKISQVETCKINQDEETTKRVRELLDNYEDKELIRNNIRIMKLDSGEVTASEISRIIKRKINEGFKPDLVIIDYFECLEMDKSDSEWSSEGKTMRKFENMATELDVAFWIPVQGNRDSISAELVTMDKAGGSLKKVQIAQVVLSITRSVEDTNNQKATLSVLKNRSGSAGIVLNGIKFDNGTCTITCDETIEFDDALVYNDFVSEKEEEIKKEMIRTARNNYR